VHNLAVEIAEKAANVETALKKQILESVDATYFEELEDPLWGHANNTARNLLAHRSVAAWATYALLLHCHTEDIRHHLFGSHRQVYPSV